MSDTKISAMTAAATLDGTEIVPLVQTGGNVQTTTANFVGQTILAAPATYRLDLGLGTIATQNASAVAITGGNINGTVIGGTTKAAGSFTTLTATGTTTLATSLTGYLKGTSGVVSASAMVPWTDISGAPATAAPAYGAFHQDGETTLTNTISNTSTAAIVVGDTTDFPSSGYILIGNELIQYSAKTATSFDGTIVRGVLGSTKASHTAGVSVTEVQGTGSPTTIGSMQLTNTDFSNGVSINASDKTQMIFAAAGIYNVQISVQVLNFDSAIDNVTVWFAQNGNNIVASSSIIACPAFHGNVPGAIILAVNIFVQTTTANEYIQMKWCSDSGNSVVATYPAGTSPVHPASPSLILTATQVG